MPIRATASPSQPIANLAHRRKQPSDPLSIDNIHREWIGKPPSYTVNPAATLDDIPQTKKKRHATKEKIPQQANLKPRKPNESQQKE